MRAGVVSLQLLVAAAAVAEEVPKGAEVPRAANLSKLEQLVSTMAAGQEDGAPAPKQVDSDVVILEEEEQHRRELRACSCTAYQDGAASGDDNLCIKFGTRHGNGVCKPYHGGCPSDYRWCTMTAAPSPLALPDVEDEADDQATTYVNAVVDLSVPSGVAYDAVPRAEAFAAIFAVKAGVTNTHVQARTVWGATAAASTGSSETLAVHVTVHVKNNKRRRAVEALIRELASLTVDNLVFQIAQVNVFPTTEYPLVCTPESEAAKDESRALLQQLVELKQQEVALMRAALTSGAETCSTNALQALASHIGMPIQ